MDTGAVLAIFISPAAGAPMLSVDTVEAVAGCGLSGDRYCSGQGSYNKEKVGKRQVTLINGTFFAGTSFEWADSRRNIVTVGVELMSLIGRQFRIGQAVFLGVKYCDPCLRPSKLAGKEASFKETFFDRGGLIAEVVQSGEIKVGSYIICLAV